MSWEDDEWIAPETKQERKERQARERQERIALRVKQAACPRVNSMSVGGGSEISTSGNARRYVTLYCPDCALEWERDEVGL